MNWRYLYLAVIVGLVVGILMRPFCRPEPDGPWEFALLLLLANLNAVCGIIIWRQIKEESKS